MEILFSAKQQAVEKCGYEASLGPRVLDQASLQLDSSALLLTYLFFSVPVCVVLSSSTLLCFGKTSFMFQLSQGDVVFSLLWKGKVSS